jgi:hypothetical protein
VRQQDRTSQANISRLTSPGYAAVQILDTLDLAFRPDDRSALGILVGILVTPYSFRLSLRPSAGPLARQAPAYAGLQPGDEQSFDPQAVRAIAAALPRRRKATPCPPTIVRAYGPFQQHDWPASGVRLRVCDDTEIGGDARRIAITVEAKICCVHAIAIS